MGQTKNVLLIGYYFPPHYSVGGRRWAKFAKSFSKEGINVSVICAETSHLDHQQRDSFGVDLNHFRIHPLKAKYPKSLIDIKPDFFSKLKFKFWRTVLRKTVSGTIYDPSLFWEKQLKRLIPKVIEGNEIDTIIVNGPPFRLMYYTLKMRREFPKVAFFVDFRDPWTWWYNMGYNELNGKDKEREMEMERFTVETADGIMVPTDIMKDILSSKYPNQSAKMKVISHCFDQEEMVANPTRLEPSESDKLKFIYYGTLYEHIGESLSELSHTLRPFKGQFQFDIYTQGKKYMEIFESDGLLGNSVFYHNRVPMREISELMNKSHFMLIVSPEFTKDNISTKFFEIIYNRIPVLFISENGMASDFFSSNGVGIVISPKDITSELPKLMANPKIVHNSNFDTSEYTFDQKTKAILSWIETLR